MLNVIETILKQGIEERGCVAARFQAKLPNGVMYFATCFEGEFSEKEVIWNSDMNAWSEFPASPGTQRYIVDLVAEIREGIQPSPDRELELIFLDVS